MTEREIPDAVGFLFGGLTDAPIPASAPPVASEPENLPTPLYSSRREARAAGGLSADPAAAAPVAPSVAAPAYDGIASLFPLLGDVTVSPLTAPQAAPSAFDAIIAAPPQSPVSQVELGATQAIPTADVAAELATPVAPYVVPQSTPIPILAGTPAATSAAPAMPAAASHQPGPAADPFVTARRSVHAAPPAHPPAHPTSRPKRSSRGRSLDRKAASRRGSSSAKPLRQRIFGVGVMVLVGGLFAVLAIPAYADNDGAAFVAAAAVQTQKVAVANTAASAITTTKRDGYTATSAADLQSLYAAAMREQNIAAYLRSGAKAQGDDYPWFAELSRNQGGGLSPLGYYYRECVDFVAWRLNRDAGSTKAPFRWVWSNLTPNGGSGHEWKANWLAHGWPTGTTPKPGAVAWFGDNHVAYVNGILANGQVFVEEYNQAGTHAYDTRVINPGDAYYLYAPPK
jgi:surface antigen